MANHKSAEKRIRQAEKRRLVNRYYGKTMRNAIRKFKAFSTKQEAANKLNELYSLIDKNAKRGIIHKNKAANLKSKLTLFYNKLP
jgi:small subunit ribosomal protein S20